MQPLLQSKSPVRYRKRLKFRYLLVAVLILLFGGMTVLANPDVRERIGKYFEQLFDDHTDVSLDVPENHKEKEFVKVKPTYIPEGCKLVKEIYEPTINKYDILYTDRNKFTLHYMQAPISFFENATFSITSNGTPAQEIDIGGFPAYLITDEYGIHSLIYVTDNYIFYTSGKINSDELIKIIKSLKKK